MRTTAPELRRRNLLFRAERGATAVFRVLRVWDLLMTRSTRGAFFFFTDIRI